MACAVTSSTFSETNLKRQEELVSAVVFPASLTTMVKNLVSLAQDHAAYPEKKIPVVGIGGCPGIGKTIFTKALAKELKQQGISSLTIHFDDWTNPAESRQEGYFNLKGVHAFFTAFLEGQKQIEKPTSAEFDDLYSKETIDLTHTDMVLFEGLFALSSKDPMDYARYCDKGIYLDASDEDIWKWKRERPSTVERTAEEFAKHMEAVFNCHRESIAPFKSQATWVVHKTSDHGYSL